MWLRHQPKKKTHDVSTHARFGVARTRRRYHATTAMDGSPSASSCTVAATGNKCEAVTFLQKLPGRVRVNEGDSVELQVVLSGISIEQKN